MCRQWEQLNPPEVFFRRLAAEEQERWEEEKGGPLLPPCSERCEADRCERCRDTHAGRSEAFGAQAAAKVALGLRSKFAGGWDWDLGESG